MTADNDIQRLDRELDTARSQLREVEQRQQETAMTLERTVILVGDIEKRMSHEKDGLPAIRTLQTARTRTGAYLVGGFMVLIFVHFLPTHETLTVDKITAAVVAAMTHIPKSP